MVKVRRRWVVSGPPTRIAVWWGCTVATSSHSSHGWKRTTRPRSRHVGMLRRGVVEALLLLLLLLLLGRLSTAVLVGCAVATAACRRTRLLAQRFSARVTLPRRIVFPFDGCRISTSFFNVVVLSLR